MSPSTPLRPRPLRPRPVALAQVGLAQLALTLAGPATAAPLARSSWTTADGLPVNAVNDVEIAQDGYVWLATFDGLVRFDGVRFSVYDVASTPGFTTNRLLTVEQAADGALWMTTEPGTILRLDPRTNAVRTWAFSQGDAPVSLVVAPNGLVWVTAPSGLMRYDGADFELVPGLSGQPVSALALAPDHAVWIGTGTQGAARIDTAGVQWFPVQDGGAFPITKLSVAPDGGVWATRWDHRLARVRGGVLEPLNLPEAPWFDASPSVVPIRADDAWIFSDRGLYRLEGERSIQVDPHSAGPAPSGARGGTDDQGHTWLLSGAAVLRDGEIVAQASRGRWTDLEIAPGGAVWVGSTGEGLLSLRDAAIETLGPELIPELQHVYALAEGADGTLWAGTLDLGLVSVGPGGARSWLRTDDPNAARSWLRPDSPLYSVTALLAEPDGAVRAGLFRRVGDEFVAEPGPPRGIVRVLERLRDGSLLAAIGVELWRQQDGVWREVTTDPPLPSAPIRAFLEEEEEEDGWWLGTNGAGLLHVVAGKLTRHGRAEGFPSDTIRSIWRSESGVLWIGTEDLGLLGWVPGAGAPRALTRRQGLPDHSVHAIVPDGLGGVWGSTNRGLFRASVEELDAWARGQRADVYVVPYGTADGMADAEANGGVHRSGLRTSDGRLWFASQAGVVVVRPDRVRQEDTFARPHVEGLRLSGHEEAVSGSRQIAPSERSFSVDYTALPAASGPKQRFWYRLDGVDPDWVDAGGRRTASYTQVPPGQHTFRVRTRHPDQADAEEATLVLDVIPYFYETVWFKLLLGAGALGTVGLGVWSRLAAAARRERVLEARVQARTADLAREKELAQAAERTIAAQAARLEEADRLKTRFFQDLSHELRTPLTLVIGPLEDVRSGQHGAIPAAASAQVGLAERNARRLFVLVNQLLDLVRLDVGALKLERSPQDLVGLVAAVVEVHQPLADRRTIRLDVDLPTDTVIVDFDRRELEKVFANLLGNALKFTPSGGRVGVRMKPGAAVDPAEVEVEIVDSGPGLSPEVRARLFERFYSQGQSPVQVGAGIGLSLARELAERHDGRIRVESEEGQGSTFTVILPRSKADRAVAGVGVATSPTPELEDDLAQAEDRADRTTVLVVDDHPELRTWIAGHLRPRYHVLEANNGLGALALARSVLPDLVVSDLMMPELDGLGLVRAMRADPELVCVPVLMLTARGSDESKIEGFRGGADAWLTKPFSSAVLIAQVDGLIAQRRLLRERLGPPPTPPAEDESLLSADERYLRKVRGVIDAQMHNPDFGVQELADAVAQDRAHLFRRLKELTGEAPSTLLRLRRLERAAVLLSRRVGTVSEIAYAVGFNGMSHFSKAFRDQYGVTPTEWSATRAGEPEVGRPDRATNRAPTEPT